MSQGQRKRGGWRLAKSTKHWREKRASVLWNATRPTRSIGRPRPTEGLDAARLAGASDNGWERGLTPRAPHTPLEGAHPSKPWLARPREIGPPPSPGRQGCGMAVVSDAAAAERVPNNASCDARGLRHKCDSRRSDPTQRDGCCRREAQPSPCIASHLSRPTASRLADLHPALAARGLQDLGSHNHAVRRARATERRLGRHGAEVPSACDAVGHGRPVASKLRRPQDLRSRQNLQYGIPRRRPHQSQSLSPFASHALGTMQRINAPDPLEPPPIAAHA